MAPDLLLSLLFFISRRDTKDCPNFRFVEMNKNWDGNRGYWFEFNGIAPTGVQL